MRGISHAPEPPISGNNRDLMRPSGSSIRAAMGGRSRDIAPARLGSMNSENPLRSGIQIGDALLMVGLASILVAIGTWLLNRRDIAV